MEIIVTKELKFKLLYIVIAGIIIAIPTACFVKILMDSGGGTFAEGIKWAWQSFINFLRGMSV